MKPTPKGRSVRSRAARIIARSPSGPSGVVPPISPKPPAAETAAASSAPAVRAIGALTIGCSIPSSSQIRVRNTVGPPCPLGPPKNAKGRLKAPIPIQALFAFSPLPSLSRSLLWASAQSDHVPAPMPSQGTAARRPKLPARMDDRRPNNDSAPLTPRTEFGGPALTFDFPSLRIGVAEYDEGPT